MQPAASHRNSHQRTVILDQLRRMSSHPTATELYELVRLQLPKISLGTVYRNLDLLAHAGLIAKLYFSAAEARYDGNPEKHFHIRCVECGRVDDFEGFSENPIIEKYANLNGYIVLGFRLEFTGICPDCRRKKRKKSVKEER